MPLCKLIVSLNSYAKYMNDSYKTQLSATCLLLSVAESDEILDEKEIETIQNILQDFFSITIKDAHHLLHDTKNALEKATGLFEFGQHLNSVFDKEDKLDFLSCIFEVAFADGELHYLEHHTVKKIANILNIDRRDILISKIKMEKYLD